MDIAMCMREMGTIEKTPGVDIFMYCGKFQALCDKLARAEIELADHVVAYFMLAGLATDPDYSTYVRITKIDKNLTARAVKTELLLEERRIDAAAVAESSGQGSALATRGQWKHRSYPNKDCAKPKGRSTGDQKCYRCGKWGQISYQCPGEKGDEEKKPKEKEKKTRGQQEREGSRRQDKSQGIHLNVGFILHQQVRKGKNQLSRFMRLKPHDARQVPLRRLRTDDWTYKDW
jgi:hypothetical protein